MKTNQVSGTSFANIFSQYLFFLFIFFIASWSRSHLFIYSFFWEMEEKEILLQFISDSVLPMFSSKCFTLSGFTFRSLINFELILCMELKNYLFIYLFLVHVAFWFSQHHLLKRLFFQYCVVSHRLIDHRCMRLISGFSILFLISIFLFLCH